MNVTELPKEQDYVFKHFVVGLFDILGQKEAILKLSGMRNTEKGRAAFLEGARNSVGLTVQARDDLRSFSDAYRTAPRHPGLANMSGKPLEDYNLLKENHLAVQKFSDTLVAYAPLAISDGRRSVHAIYEALTGSGGMLLLSLARGIPIRGGIEVDVAVELEPFDLYGPAFVRAYELESRVAEFPRVAVGSRLLDELNHFITRNARSEFDQINQRIALLCKDLIAWDSHGVAFVDFLGPVFRDGISYEVFYKAAPAAKAFIQKEHERFTREGCKKLAERYGVLLQYFNDRLSNLSPA